MDIPVTFDLKMCDRVTFEPATFELATCKLWTGNL